MRTLAAAESNSGSYDQRPDEILAAEIWIIPVHKVWMLIDVQLLIKSNP